MPKSPAPRPAARDGSSSRSLPLAAIVKALALPYGQPLLDRLDHEPIRLVRLRPMPRRGHDGHGRLTDWHQPEPMDDGHRGTESALRLRGNLLDDRQRHLGIDLVVELDDGPPVIGDVPRPSDEADDRPVSGVRHRGLEGGDIDRLVRQATTASATA